MTGILLNGLVFLIVGKDVLVNASLYKNVSIGTQTHSHRSHKNFSRALTHSTSEDSHVCLPASGMQKYVSMDTINKLDILQAVPYMAYSFIFNLQGIFDVQIVLSFHSCLRR